MSHLQASDSLVPDFVKPLLSRPDLATQLQAFYPRCKAHLFSGALGATDLSGTVPESDCEFEMISKPVHPKTLVRKVQDMRVIGERWPPTGKIEPVTAQPKI